MNLILRHYSLHLDCSDIKMSIFKTRNVSRCQMNIANILEVRSF